MKDELFFETIRCEDFTPLHLTFHKKRIAYTIGLNIELQEYIYPPNDQLLKCKVIYNKNEIVDISYTSYKPKNIKTFKLVFDDDIQYKYKYLNRDSIDKLYNQKDDCDDIIIVKDGYLMDTSIANIAVFLDNIWYTPAIPLLEGTTKNRLLEDKFLQQKNITVDELKRCEKFAIMNAMVGFRQIEDFKIKGYIK